MNREFPPSPDCPLRGSLFLPGEARELVLLAELEPTPYSAAIAADLASRGYATLVMALLRPEEAHFADHGNNVPLLTERLLEALDFIRNDGDTEGLNLGLFAVGPTTPAAIRAAARRDAQVRALACHGGLVDLAGRQYLDLLAAPLLMLVDAGDMAAVTSFQHAAPHLLSPHELLPLLPEENPSGHIAWWFEGHLQAI